MAKAPPAPNFGNLLGGTTKSHRINMTWNHLTGQERDQQWGRINDIFRQILGRSATTQEAMRLYNMGLGDYAIQQQLYMSKEFRHTPLYNQLSREYSYYLQQFVGNSIRLTPKQIQAFAAHGYNETDIQAWVYSHPNVYRHSHDYKARVQSFQSVYQNLYGVDPLNIIPGQHRVDTNKKKPGVQGQNFQPLPNEVMQHIGAAAMHFQTPQEYEQWLRGQHSYQAHALGQTQAHQTDAELQLAPNGRPVQNGLQPRAAADIPA